ncbi:MAG: Tat pathway signal protein [Oceanospirillaceae bacterium]|nr:Tat pathway signal protein [Oceanospirillaceae bacterium]|tara:strand:- start:63 stop:533 length:471 start_codon:yes stop_codon:yes gene_type:complete
MKHLVMILCLLSALALSTQSTAREIVLSTELQSYSGNGAYLAIYLTNAKGQYQETLWIAGQKSKYYKHLTGWARGSGLRTSEYDGISGASVTSGKTLTVSLELADTYIDTGFQLRVDSSVEDMRDNRNDVVVPLTSEGAGKLVNGNGYVKTFTYSF